MAKRFKIEVHPGDRYGKLTVIKEVEKHKFPSGTTSRVILCQCDCGSDPVRVLLSNLRKGTTTSCGCTKEKIKNKIVPGEKYGRLTVIGEAEPYIQPSGQKRRMIRCKCSCGNPEEVVVRIDILISGQCKSCGCYKKEKDIERGKSSKKYNTYDLSGEYGIGYTLKGEPFLFDKEDYDLIKDCCWGVSKGYITGKSPCSDKMVSMHRLVMHAKEGDIIDHIFRKKNDNRKSQLRKVTVSQNAMNSGVRSDNTSGITGVKWNKKREKWEAGLQIDKKYIHLGIFSNKQDAIEARLKAELELFGEYSPNYEKLIQQQSDQQSQQNT